MAVPAPGARNSNMPLNVTRMLIRSRLESGSMVPGDEIALRIDQVLLQDVLGALVMLEMEAMGIERVEVPLAVQYIDHNLLETNHLNGDEHIFLRSACRRFGIWYSRAGNGISHPVHMQRFGRPGETLIGCDSHTAAAGALGMFALGAGGIDVALALSGEPARLSMPAVFGVKLTGELPNWVSAKDVILEILRRHGLDGGSGRVVEYYGPGLAGLSAMDRHVIANMGAELGATTTVFPSDERTRAFLRSVGREDDWRPIAAEGRADYDIHDEIDLSSLEPLIAKPSSPANVVPVRDVSGAEICQAYIGSSANPGFRDYAVAAAMVKGRTVHERVSLDINPSSRQTLRSLVERGHIVSLIDAGARLHDSGCNGCCGMGQAPAAGKISLRTVPRNFPGRSGTRDDRIYLCSPETATASALMGAITDPRDLGIPYQPIEEPERMAINTMIFVPPPREGPSACLETSASITRLPHFTAVVNDMEAVILLKTGDDISTDDIIAVGDRIMPHYSNLPKAAEFTFEAIDDTYARRAGTSRDRGQRHAIVGGVNYGQGSSREHAALLPRYLGLSLVIAKSFARIHWQNLVNFGVLPLTFVDPGDYESLEPGNTIMISGIRDTLRANQDIEAEVKESDLPVRLRHALSERQVDVLLAGGAINWRRERSRRIESPMSPMSARTSRTRSLAPTAGTRSGNQIT
jgi:aconitate hydratase